MGGDYDSFSLEELKVEKARLLEKLDRLDNENSIGPAGLAWIGTMRHLQYIEPLISQKEKINGSGH